MGTHTIEAEAKQVINHQLSSLIFKQQPPVYAVFKTNLCSCWSQIPNISVTRRSLCDNFRIGFKGDLAARIKLNFFISWLSKTSKFYRQRGLDSEWTILPGSKLQQSFLVLLAMSGEVVTMTSKNVDKLDSQGLSSEESSLSCAKTFCKTT